MMRKVKLFMSMLAAVMAFGVLVAASASATVQPLFLTESKATLSFTASGGLVALRGEAAGIPAEIHCEKSIATGKIQNKSMLAVEISILFKGKCEQNGGGVSKAACTEPIALNEVKGELGLIALGGTIELVGLDVLPVSSSEFVTVTCGPSKTTFKKEVIGIFPVKSKYNKLEASIELAFKSKGTVQEPKSIEELGVTFIKVEITPTGFMGGEASLAATMIITPDALVEIRTTGK